ncbi:hypothetical protein [Streptomyces althioticus]|uniref:hypothetical protein n=1 Tax=Streptomyces althioticus group TaxID=2867194 RepID=UPI0019A9042C|nr:hypothetical protein GCM10010267_24520 [Streptomyces griseorubens]
MNVTSLAPGTDHEGERHDHRTRRRSAERLPRVPGHARLRAVDGRHEDFVYGEDVTIGDWTIPTDGLPRYRDEESGQASAASG